MYSASKLVPIVKIRVYVHRAEETDWEYYPIIIDINGKRSSEYLADFDRAVTTDIGRFQTSLPGKSYEEREAVSEELTIALEHLKDYFEGVDIGGIDILYGEGISHEGEIVDIGVDLGGGGKADNWYSYAGDKIGQGKDNARNFQKDDPEIAAEIDGKIRKNLCAKEKNNDLDEVDSGEVDAKA